MLVAGTLMLPDTSGDTGAVRLADGYVRIEDGRIAECREGAAPGTPDAGGDGFVVMPGFIDAHLHLPQFDSIGADGMTLLDWLERVIFPAEMAWEDADYAGAMTERVLDQLIARGTTGFAAYATVHHAGAIEAIRASERRGVRAIIGQVLMDQEGPDGLLRPTGQLLDECAAFLGIEQNGRVEPSVNPRFAITCSGDLLAGAGDLARKHAAPVQTHLAETVAETRRVAELHDGHRYVEVYDRAGLLTPRTLLAHAIHLDASDLTKIADAGSIIAHCPTANTFLQSGALNRHGALASGVRVSIGSDVAGGPDRSMSRVARAMIDTAKSIIAAGPNAPNLTDRYGHRHPHHPVAPPTPAEAWHQVTAANADALGWPQCGRLFGGAEADIIVINPDVRWREAVDPLGALLYGWDDRWLTHTIVAGRVAYES